MNSFWISWYTHCVDSNHMWNAHEILLNIRVRLLINFINYFGIETHPTSRYEFILDFMVRTALTVHEIFLNIYPISRYVFILDFMVKRLPWNGHEIVWNITVHFLLNFINYFCIETLSHISIWIHFGFRGTQCVDGTWNTFEHLPHVLIWIYFGFHGTQCDGSNHKILSCNAHEIAGSSTIQKIPISYHF